MPGCTAVPFPPAPKSKVGILQPAGTQPSLGGSGIINCACVTSGRASKWCLNKHGCCCWAKRAVVRGTGQMYHLVISESIPILQGSRWYSARPSDSTLGHFGVLIAVVGFAERGLACQDVAQWQRLLNV